MKWLRLLIAILTVLQLILAVLCAAGLLDFDWLLVTLVPLLACLVFNDMFDKCKQEGKA
jgi:hypothetical protein